MNRNVILVLWCVAAAGCNTTSITVTPAPVDVTGSVKLAGQPLDEGTLNLQPTGPGNPATIPVKKGSFQAKVTPGRYTYFFSEGGSRATFAKIPVGYRAGSMDRQIDVASGSTLEFAIQ